MNYTDQSAISVSALEDVQSDPLLAITSHWGTEFGNYTLLLAPIALLLLIWILIIVTRYTRWDHFANSHILWARSILIVFSIAILFCISGTSSWMLTKITGKISPEFPSATGTAIKLGIFDLEFHQQSAKQIPAEQRDLFECVAALSMAEANNYLNACKDSFSCIQSIPLTTKQDILQEIKDVQAGKIAADTQMQVCFRVSLK